MSPRKSARCFFKLSIWPCLVLSEMRSLYLSISFSSPLWYIPMTAFTILDILPCKSKRTAIAKSCEVTILVPRAHDPSCLCQKSRALPFSCLDPIFWSCAEYSFRTLNQPDFPDLTESPWNEDFWRWTKPEFSIPGTGQKDRGVWEREWWSDPCRQLLTFNDTGSVNRRKSVLLLAGFYLDVENKVCISVIY